MSRGNAIQAAIYTRLSGYAPLSGVYVYDGVPQNATPYYPSITIGEDIATAWDTDEKLGAEIIVAVHVWSRSAGRQECKNIQGHIFDAMARYELTVTGYKMVTIEFEGEESFLEPDGETRHGVSKFRVYLTTT